MNKVSTFNVEISELDSGKEILRYLGKDYSHQNIINVSQYIRMDLESSPINWSKHHIRHLMYENGVMNSNDLVYLQTSGIDGELLRTKIAHTLLPCRVITNLIRNHIYYVWELICLHEEEFKSLDGLGSSSIQTVVDYMTKNNLKFKEVKKTSIIKNMVINEEGFDRLSVSDAIKISELKSRNKFIEKQIELYQIEQEQNNKTIQKLLFNKER